MRVKIPSYTYFYFILTSDLYLSLPVEFYLICCSFILIFLDSTFFVLFTIKSKNIGYFFFFLSLVICYYAKSQVSLDNSIYFLSNAVINYNKIIFVILFLIILCLIIEFTQQSRGSELFPYFLLFLSLINLILSSSNILVIYMCIEGIAFLTYLLLNFALSYQASNASEASIKYFILNSIISLFLLFSILFFLFSTGGFEQSLSSLTSTADPYFFLSFLFFFSSILAKVGVLPISVWLIDVYDGTPIHLLALLLVPLKLMLIFVCLKILFFIFYFYFLIISLICKFLAYSSILLSLSALFLQTTLRRFIGYTAFNQVGFILMGLSTVTVQGYIWVFIYALIYSVTILNLLILFSLCNYNYIFLSDLGKFFSFNNFYTYIFIILVFSFAGIPPLAGFYIKFYILLELLNTGAIFSVLFILISSIVGCFFYLILLVNLILWNVHFTQYGTYYSRASIFVKIYWLIYSLFNFSQFFYINFSLSRIILTSFICLSSFILISVFPCLSFLYFNFSRFLF